MAHRVVVPRCDFAGRALAWSEKQEPVAGTGCDSAPTEDTRLSLAWTGMVGPWQGLWCQAKVRRAPLVSRAMGTDEGPRYLGLAALWGPELPAGAGGRGKLPSAGSCLLLISNFRHIHSKVILPRAAPHSCSLQGEAFKAIRAVCGLS